MYKLSYYDIFPVMRSSLAIIFIKCYTKEELFLFGVKDCISKTFRLDDHWEQG
jgi:hypothetical protein